MERVLADAIAPPASRKPPEKAVRLPRPTQEEIDRIKEQQRQNQARKKADQIPSHQ